MVKNTKKKGVRIKTQKQSYRIFIWNIIGLIWLFSYSEKIKKKPFWEMDGGGGTNKSRSLNGREKR